jgi:FAD/FMN-containing dehydrogenase
MSIGLGKAVKMVTESGLAEIVTPENVSADPAVLDAYAADQSFVAKMRPQFVVKVASREEVQRLVALAKQTGTPLVPVSSGGPHFHGDTVPSTGGAVVVDLSGMKKIDLIEQRERVASVVEPGVTFAELAAAAAKKGLRLNMPLAPRATKSVVGSMLSREAVTMPRYHWDISDPIGSTEVVFGTGDMFRTGAAAGPGDIAEQRAAGGRQKEAAGPSAMSLHRLLQGAQGTMGIVTWASVRCELIPAVEQPYFVGSGDVAELLETAHWLTRLRLGNELLILNAADAAALLATADADYARLVARLPQWLLFFNLAAYQYLPEMRMEGQIQDTRELLQRLGQQTSQIEAGISAAEFLEAIRRPSLEPYWKLRRGGGVADIFFITTSGKVPGLIKVMGETAQAAGYATDKMGIYVQPIVQGSNTHVEFSLFYDPADPAETRVVRELATSAIQPLMNAGAFFSRPFGEASKHIMNRDAAGVDALKKFKAIVDPAGILNPGKLCF